MRSLVVAVDGIMTNIMIVMMFIRGHARVNIINTTTRALHRTTTTSITSAGGVGTITTTGRWHCGARTYHTHQKDTIQWNGIFPGAIRSTLDTSNNYLCYGNYILAIYI